MDHAYPGLYNRHNYCYCHGYCDRAELNYDKAYFDLHESTLQDPGVYHGIATVLHKVYGVSRSVLEIGCGRGYITRHLKSLFGLVIGVDISEYAIQNPVNDELHLAKADVSSSLLFPPRMFDLTFSWQVLEHLPDEAAATKAITAMDNVTRWFQVHSIYLSSPESPEEENRFHTLLKERAWWLEIFGRAGWTEDPARHHFFTQIGKWNTPEIFCLYRV